MSSNTTIFSDFLSNDEGRSALKEALNSYNDRLHSEFNFPPLKMGKQLHTFAKAAGFDNWHQVSYLTSTSQDSDSEPLFMVDYWECNLFDGRSDPGIPRVFRGTRASIEFIADYVFSRIVDIEPSCSRHINDIEEFRDDFPSLLEELSCDCLFTSTVLKSVYDFLQDEGEQDCVGKSFDFLCSLLEWMNNDEPSGVILSKLSTRCLFRIVDAYMGIADDEMTSAGYYIHSISDAIEN